MARKPMITRTLKSYNSTVIAFKDSDNTTYETQVTTTVDTDKSRAAALPDGERLIKTLNTEVTESLVGMTVDEFMQYAKPVKRGKAEDEENE